MNTANFCCEWPSAAFEFRPRRASGSWSEFLAGLCRHAAATWRAFQAERALDRALADFSDDELRTVGQEPTPHRRAMRPFRME